MSLITWSTPKLSDMIIGCIVLGTISLIKTIVSITRKHTISIYHDIENGYVLISQLKAFRPNIQTTLQVDTMYISALKNEGYTYFNLMDSDHRVCISSSHYKISEKKLKKIHKKLSSIVNTTTLCKII